MERIAASLVLVVVLLFSTSVLSLAAPKKSSSASFSARGQILKNRNTVRAFFGNLKGIKSVSYTLYYNGNGIGQGVYGSFSPGKKTSWSKDLYLGTCSGKVCIAHRNVKNIKMEVVTRSTTGKSSTKVISIK